MGALVVLVVVGTSIWVLIDASTHGIRSDYSVTWYRGGPVGWGVGCLLLWIVVFPTYIAARSRLIAVAESQRNKPYVPYFDAPKQAADSGSTATAAVTLSVADELSKLKALRESGDLSEAEFQVQRTRLLG